MRASRLRSLSLALIGTILLASAAPAQNAAPANNAPLSLAADSAAKVAKVAGPTLAAAAVAVHVSDAPRPAAAAPSTQRQDDGEKLMIIGVAAVLTGVVVGGDPGHVISVGGALAGLYGLYKYLY